MSSEVLNVLVHADYAVDRGVGPIVYYHGSTIDLRSVPKEKADEMASDPHHQYVRYSPEYWARKEQAAIDEQRDQQRRAEPAAAGNHKPAGSKKAKEES